MRRGMQRSATHQRSDEDLYRDYCQRERAAAFEGLVERYWQRAFRLAFAILRRPGAAEDVAQSAFIRLMRAARRNKPVREFWPWFKTLILNEARVALRSRKRRDDHESRFRQAPRVARAARDPGAAVREIAEGLPENLRRPLELHYAAGLSYAEVARVLGCPQGTVCTRIRSAIKRLRKSLAARGFAPAGAALVALIKEGAAEAAVPAAPSLSALLRRSRGLLWSPGLIAIASALILALSAAVLVLPGGEQAGKRRPETVARVQESPPLAPRETSSEPRSKGTASAEKDEAVEPLPGRASRAELRGPASDAGLRPSAGGSSGNPTAKRPAKTPVPVPGEASLESMKGVSSGPAVHRQLRALAVSRDRQRLVSAGGDEVRFWSLDRAAPQLPQPALRLEKSVRLPIEHPLSDPSARIQNVSFAEDGRVYVSHGESIFVVHPERGLEREIPRPKSRRRGPIQIAPEGDMMLEAGTGRAWSLPSIEERPCGIGPSTELLFSPSGALIAAWKMRSKRASCLELYDGRSLERVARFPVTTLAVLTIGARSRLAFSPDERRVFLIDCDQIFSWDLEAKRPLPAVSLPRGGELRRLSPSSDGRALIGGTESGGLKVFDLESGALLRSFEGHHGAVIGLAPIGGSYLVSGARDNTLRLWDTRSGRSLTSDKGHSGGIARLVFSRDGRRLVSVGSHSAHLWDVASRDHIARLEGLAYPMSLVATPGEADLVTVRQLDRDPRPLIEHWSLETGERLESRSWKKLRWNSGHRRIAPDGARLLCLDADERFVLADLRDRAAEPVLLQGLGKLDRFYRGHAFTRDGSLLALAEADPKTGYRISVYDTEAGTRLKALSPSLSKRVYGSRASRVLISEDQRVLVVADSFGDARAWDLETGKERLHAKRFEPWALSPDGRSILGFLREVQFKNGEVETLLIPARLSIDSLKAEGLGIAPVSGKWLWRAALSPDGSTLVLGGVDGRLQWHRLAE